MADITFTDLTQKHGNKIQSITQRNQNKACENAKKNTSKGALKICDAILTYSDFQFKRFCRMYRWLYDPFLISDYVSFNYNIHITKETIFKKLTSTSDHTVMLTKLEAYSYCWMENRILYFKTYPTDCQKTAAVDSHNSIGIERKENINKNWFLYKNIFKCELFWCHFVIEHTPVSRW